MSLRLASLFAVFFCFALCFQPRQALTQKQIPDNQAKEIEENLSLAKILEASNDFNQAVFHLNKAATIYWVNGHSQKAIEIFEQAIKQSSKIGNLNAIKTFYTNIGLIYTDNEDFSKALQAFSKSLEVSRQMNRKSDIAASLLNLANVHSEMNNFNEALKNLDEATSLGKDLNDERLLRSCYSLLASLYEKLGNTQKSTEYFSLFTTISRKIQHEEAKAREGEAKKIVDEAKSKVSAIEQAKQATEKELLDKERVLKEAEHSLEELEQISLERQMQIDLLNKEKELRDAELKNQKLVRNVFLFIIFVVMSFAILFFYNLNVKKKANEQLQLQNIEIAEQKNLIEKVNHYLESALKKIEKQNNNITSSINYAQRIQEAMLPSPDNLSTVFNDSFILLNPREIVSGDFYWFSGYKSINNKNGKRKNFIKLHNIAEGDEGFIISSADCTGHGIPGAFMSMIGLNLLETITRNGIVKPNEILTKLHDSIRHLLKQNSTNNRDGMDMTICSIVNGGKKVLFAGAKNPLIFITDGELVYLKGDPVPVGGMQKEDNREFTLHTINVDKPTSFYLFSDGYTDQFGGPTGQKFGTKNFKNLLLDIHKLPMPEQKQILVERMNSWIGPNRSQIDDIIVVGFRIDEGIVNI